MKKFKRGDVREDGMVFWQYHNKGGEYWVTPDKFIFNKERQKQLRCHNINLAKKNNTRSRQRGDVREDGMVFWSYHPDCKDGERWVIREKFNQQRLKCRTPEHRLYMNNYEQQRRLKDPMFALTRDLRRLTVLALSSQGWRKQCKTSKMIGCSVAKLRAHIENQFTEGMNWNNRGQGQDCWNIDHILPLAAGKAEGEIIALGHYTNLQPMWSTENIAKHDKHCPKELAEYLAIRLQQQPLTSAS